MPLALLIPLIEACISASPAAITAISGLVKSFQDAGHTTLTPAHVTAISAVLAAHAQPPEATAPRVPVNAIPAIPADAAGE